MGERRAVFGTVALTIVNALKLGMQMAVLPVLGRLLGPSAFGLVALAMPVILLATMISDAGLGNALVRERGSSRELESTIFWLSLMLSVALAVFVGLLAVPISAIFSEPNLVPILIALTIILPLSASLSVPNARISRARQFSLFAVGDVISGLSSAAAAIAAALAGAGAWSLVIQQCVLWIVKACWVLPVSGFRPMLVCRPTLAAPHLSFGLNAVGASLADFANKSVPTIVVGGLIGVTAAGHYSMAYQIVRVPDLIISGPLYLSIFASVAQSDRGRSGTTLLARRGLRGVITLLAPLFAGLATISHLVVQLLLGPAWAATAPILLLLTPAGFLLCIYSYIGAVFMGLGRSESQFRLIVLTGVFLAGGTLLGARFGAQGVAIGFSSGAAMALPAYLFALSRQLHTPVTMIAHEAVGPLVATSAMAVAVVALMQKLPPQWNAFSQVSILASVGCVTYVLVLVLVSGPQLRDDLSSLLMSNRRANSKLAAPHWD